MTVKRDTIGSQPPIRADETAKTAAAGLFDVGAPIGARKRLFQFAKRSRKTALGPSRSEFGCD